ncbi:MAG TPA: hypothetical protein VMT39_00260 [Candidatus Bathyarchaeia archaeon]|nr:hypothetical protein [Candidatus Bathyarchaeia archaeon]
MRTSGPITSRVYRRQPYGRVFAALLLFVTFPACKTSTEGVAAATQLTRTSQQLSAYYGDLSSQVQDTVALKQIQADVMFGSPFDSSIQNELDETRRELAQRQALAVAMGNVATAYAALAGTNSAADIGSAASGLAKQCEDIHKLPGGPAIPDVVGKAAQLLLDQIRERKLRQSSETISNAVKAVGALFDAEKPVYESINSDRIKLASEIARHLVKKEDVVDLNPALAPALKPFDLTANLPVHQPPDKYRSLAAEEITARSNQQISDYAAASDALSASLKAVSEQIAKVAKSR